ncbi:MAG: tRNA (adenosine(37)-N6)-threonylcarbamoyltransferase complex transferase subunit TsaD [Chloroflexi bacterium RBG_13_51_52]|nr:MAG: tRNA (adenosine(37)-N6)-threonylcarbamoyltransferase complex transferase subunit TsaD [Chloroflexi bacterium RBG_13_51_52]
MLILGIETSCDETSAALVADGKTILSSTIATQLDLLKKYGGVVPEVAARRHAELIGYVIKEALDTAGKTLDDVEAVAVTSRQGLIGCLMVGVAAAKSISYARQVPLIGLHHIEGHIFANILSNPDLPVPHICLTVSGGHNMLVHVQNKCRYELLGTTLDDAAGEAFDKIAKFLGLGFPGGPAIDKLSQQGNRKAFNFPRPMIKNKALDFSFSGLKTAVINMFKAQIAGGEPLPLADIAASFQEAIVDTLVAKTLRAVEEKDLKIVSVTGGVSANSRLRQVFTEVCKKRGIKVFFPKLSLCTDNAAMIAAAGYARMMLGERSDLRLNVFPNAPLGG